MAGVGKLLKQAQKMQKQMEAVQAELSETEMEVSSGGGAVRVTITGQGEFTQLSLDPEFLKEEPQLIEETLLAAIRDAADQAREVGEKKMNAVSGGMNLPGFM